MRLILVYFEQEEMQVGTGSREIYTFGLPFFAVEQECTVRHHGRPHKKSL
jgi:hypothetical protein